MEKHTLEYLNWLLGEALEDRTDAAGASKSITGLDPKKALDRIAQAILLLWDVRKYLFTIKPELETLDSPSLAAKSCSWERFERLTRLHDDASTAERAGDVAAARHLFTELRDETAPGGFYRVVAEAGLYRLSAE